MPIEYQGQEGSRFKFTEDRDTTNFQDDVDENAVKILVITGLFFSFYIAIMIAGAHETNLGIKALFDLILSIFNLGVILYAVAIGYYTVKTLFSWFKQAVQRMR